jgi:hypothetical protein
VGNGPLDALTSPPGALGLAVAALLLVLGLRLAPRRGVTGAAAAATYAASLAVTLLGALRVLPGPALAAPLGLRLAGAAAIFAGLLAAGALARLHPRGEGGRGAAPRAPTAVYAGLALVLLGQLLRAPSAAGILGVAAAAIVHGWAAWAARRPAAGV